MSSATHDAVSDGVAAWSRIRERERASWADRVAVGRALIIGRAVSLGTAETNRPVGSRYNRAMGQWLREHDLADINNQERYRCLLVLENLPAISAWRDGLDEAKRRRLNHPNAIWAHWRQSTKPAAPRQKVAEDASPSQMVYAAAEAARRGKAIYRSQAALRRAHQAMLDAGSNDLLVLARKALESAIRNEADLVELLGLPETTAPRRSEKHVPQTADAAA